MEAASVQRLPAIGFFMFDCQGYNSGVGRAGDRGKNGWVIFMDLIGSNL